MIGLRKNSKSKWPIIFLIVTVLVYLIYLLMSAYTFTNLPPIPDKLVTSDGKILFTSQEIIQGKYLFQKYGLMDYGSVLGFGGYFGIDFTSYTLALDENYIASYYGFKNVSTTNTSEMTIIKNALNVNYNKVTNTVTMSIPFGIAFEKSIAYYSNYLGNESAQIRLNPLSIYHI
ncbi:MAG: hypothetical protein QXH95_06050 [Thermoplasmata archaeon]